MGNIISASGLRFLDLIRYPQIRIGQGSTTFICGESGCGKSTLLRLLNATVSPSAGVILYHGENIEQMDSVVLRREVLLVPQTVFLFDGTIEENFERFCEYRDTPCIDKTEMERFLALCCAPFLLDTKCETMSGGEKQRVFLAICLSFCPRVLMLDEPTSALDEKTADEFFAGVKNFCAAQEMTLIVVSHQRALAAKYADSILELEKETQA